MKLTNKIQLELMSYSKTGGADIIIPNYYDEYEMDVMAIKPSGYIYEYEIKISKADYKKDFDKGVYELFNGDIYKVGKHEKLRDGKLLCNRFYFVVPKDLISIDEVPSYAGLIYYKTFFRLVKNAPLLHRNKFDGYKGLCEKLAFREHNFRRKSIYYQKEYKRLKNNLDF